MKAKFTFKEPVTIYSPSIAGGDVLLTYPRLVEIKYSKEHKETLIATGETLEVPYYKVFRSTDGGESWQHISNVKEQLEPKLVCNWQPHIYELPNQVGDMPKGTILVSGCTRDRRVQKITKMCIWRSNDLGETWKEISVVDVGGRIDHGMYESFLICDEDGTLVCFYSDETEVDDVHGQRLVFKTSRDGVNWSEKKYVCAPKDKSLRPGMLTVAKTDFGKYIAAFELVKVPGHPVCIKISDSLTNWEDPEDMGTVVKTEDGTFLSSTPYVEWIPYGEKGIIIVGGWKNIKDNKESGAGLYVSFDMGETFEILENPLPYPYPEKHRHGYSPLLLASEDKKEIFYINAVPWEGNTEDHVRTKYDFTKISVE